MTAQINDKLRFDKSDFDIVAIENTENFFDFEKIGLKPIANCTACWRGYIAIFGIDEDNNLVLKDLYSNNDDMEPPLINGVEVFEINDWQENLYTLAGNLVYKDINLPITYTGSFLIGDNFIRELYVHMGFQHPFKYEYLEEFIFENGVCIETRDLSKEAKERREKEKSTDKVTKSPVQWIEDQFDLGYRKKW
jgi:glutaredoxin